MGQKLHVSFFDLGTHRQMDPFCSGNNFCLIYPCIIFVLLFSALFSMVACYNFLDAFAFNLSVSIFIYLYIYCITLTEWKAQSLFTPSCSSLWCRHGLQANSYCLVLHINMLIIRRILLASWGDKGVWIVYQRTLWLDSHQQARLSPQPPDVCGVNHLCPLQFPLPLT